MTGLRIKILRSKEQPVGLGIRIKRWFSRIAVWFQAPQSQTPTAGSRGLRIRVLNSSGAAVTGPTLATNTPNPCGSTAGGGPSQQHLSTAAPTSHGIVFNEGVRLCKTCGDTLFDGRELVECSANPAHRIHATCVELARHLCPDCQSALY